MPSPEHPAPTETHAETHAEAHPKSAGDMLLTPQPGLIIWTLVTFGLLLIVLKKFAWGPMLQMLDDREKTISDALAKSAQARVEAEKILTDQKSILADARREAQELVKKSREDAERARETTLAQARTQSEKLIADGKAAIDKQRDAAVKELRTVAVDLALGAASRLIEVEVDDRQQRGKVTEFVDELAQRRSGSA